MKEQVMIRFVSALCAGALMGGIIGSAAAQTIDPVQRGMVDAAGVQAAIELQIEAIGRGDFKEAFAYASPQIQRRFMTPDNFEKMVRDGYPMVHMSMRHSFGPLMFDGRHLRQAVVLTDQAGRVWQADYHMKMVDGVWYIDGFSLRPAVQTEA
ncbi:MAG: hypothetical protein ACJARE_002809 [Paracoccaceae bacterium]